MDPIPRPILSLQLTQEFNMADDDGNHLMIRDDDFPVSEVFVSIQGEGNCAGINSLFIRFQFCNLRCPWCDTQYTWTRLSNHFDMQTAEQVKQTIQKHPQQHVILTGGEPALFRLDLLAVTGKKMHVESNGTIIPTQPLQLKLKGGAMIQREAMDEGVIGHFNWVISPKLSNAQQPIHSEAIGFWSRQSHAIFKFIVQNEQDIDEVDAFIEEYGIDKNRVYLGLLGTTIESQLRPEFVDTIVLRGYHVSPRLHILLWGQSRGK